jgi:hypothetical protein
MAPIGMADEDFDGGVVSRSIFILAIERGMGILDVCR